MLTDGYGHCRSQVIADLSHQGYKVVLVTSGRVWEMDRPARVIQYSQQCLDNFLGICDQFGYFKLAETAEGRYRAAFVGREHWTFGKNDPWLALYSSLFFGPLMLAVEFLGWHSGMVLQTPTLESHPWTFVRKEPADFCDLGTPPTCMLVFSQPIRSPNKKLTTSLVSGQFEPKIWGFPEIVVLLNHPF